MKESIIKTIEFYERGIIRCIECGATNNLMSVESGTEDETGCDHQTFLVCQSCYDDEDRPYECTPLV